MKKNKFFIHVSLFRAFHWPSKNFFISPHKNLFWLRLCEFKSSINFANLFSYLDTKIYFLVPAQWKSFRLQVMENGRQLTLWSRHLRPFKQLLFETDAKEIDFVLCQKFWLHFISYSILRHQSTQSSISLFAQILSLLTISQVNELFSAY